MNDIFKPEPMFGELVCRCDGRKLRYFGNDAVHRHRISVCKKQLKQKFN